MDSSIAARVVQRRDRCCDSSAGTHTRQSTSTLHRISRCELYTHREIEDIFGQERHGQSIRARCVRRGSPLHEVIHSVTDSTTAACKNRDDCKRSTMTFWAFEIATHYEIHSQELSGVPN
ncbi:hypothetical protein EVAR_36030_1 [Eumeta japonica]|uniref:Uncharacterized protein n=1 Tax=Eumeta variegata TaxID=151549 RepID=A0A4C1WQW3_EUMVA|nr:hypothetical protein EVAR_36030_1 [Eumeta japonica]